MEGTKRATAWVLVLIVFEEAIVTRRPWSRDDIQPLRAGERRLDCLIRVK